MDERSIDRLARVSVISGFVPTTRLCTDANEVTTANLSSCIVAPAGVPKSPTATLDRDG